jgi:hypothetical protein
METEGTSCPCCQAAEVARLRLHRPTVAGTVIWPFEGYGPEHSQRHKTGQIAHHRSSQTSWVGCYAASRPVHQGLDSGLIL